MAGRDVVLTLKVRDGEVDKGIASLNRLKQAANDAGTGTFGGKAATATEEQQKRLAAFMGKNLPTASNTASNAMTQVDSAMAAVADGSAAARAGLAGVTAAGALLTVGAALLVVGLIALVAAMAAIFKKAVELSKVWSDYTLEIANSAEANGLATETFVALRHEVEAQGRSFGVIESSVNSFRKMIGEATAGSKEALASLRLLGIDGSKAIYDIDGAFKQAIVAIGKAPSEFERVRIAFAAFGDDAPKILPILRDMGYDLDKVKQKAAELGIQLGDKETAQAREFARAYADIEAVIQGLKMTFIREFAPDVIAALQEFNTWLNTNKAEIKEWAVWIGEQVGGVVYYFVLLIEKLAQIKRDMQEMADMEARNRGDYVPPRFSGPTALPMQPHNWGLTPGPDLGRSPDAGALTAALSFKPKREKKPELSDAEKQAKDLRKMISDLTIELQFFGEKSAEAAMRQDLLKKGIFMVNAGLADTLIALAQDKDAKIANAEATRKAEEAAKKYAEILNNQREAVANQAFDQRQALTEQEIFLTKQLELGRELTEYEKAEINNLRQLSDAREAARRAGVMRVEDLDDLEDRIAREQELTRVIRERVQVLIDEAKERDRVKARDLSAKDFQQSLDDELASVLRLGQPLTVYEQTLQEIARSQHKYTEEQKAGMLVTAEQIDAIRELNRQHAELKEFFNTSLRYIFEGNFKGLFQNLQDRFKDMFADKLADVFATSVLGFNPNQTNNPVAKPIVSSIGTTNKILNQILVKMGGAPVGGGGAGGIGGIFSSILGGFGGGGMGPGGTPYFNPNRFTTSGQAGINMELPPGFNGTGRGGSGGGGIWANLKQLFSTGPGGIFAPQRNLLTGKDSKWGGILGGAGSLLSLFGGIIGGNTGSVLSGIGTGAQIGAMFGPIGAAIGAVVGGIASIFGINKQRREDERSRTQALLSAEAAIKQEFEALMTQLRFGTIDPSSAINQAASSSASIRSQYIEAVSQLKDGKTRRIALSEVQQRIDPLIAQKTAELKALAEIAAASADRSKRILPEFAGGQYIADFFRPNGLIPGVFDSRDDLMAMLSRGEMVLNPMQQNAVRSNAGFDVFAGAGIPNYPRANPTANLAVGGIANTSLALSAAAPQPVVHNTVEVTLVGVPIDQHIEGYITSDKGERQQIRVIKKLQKSGDI